MAVDKNSEKERTRNAKVGASERQPDDCSPPLQSQKAHRERKAQYIASLETRIASLVEAAECGPARTDDSTLLAQVASLLEENMYLHATIARLRAEQQPVSLPAPFLPSPSTSTYSVPSPVDTVDFEPASSASLPPSQRRTLHPSD